MRTRISEGPVTRTALGAYALAAFASSCDLGMGREPHIDENVGPHEIEVEGVVIDRGPPDDIFMLLACAGGSNTDTGTVLAGHTLRVDVSRVEAPTELECTLSFEPRDPLAAPVFIQWLTSVRVGYGSGDRDAGVDVVVDVMASEP